MKYQVSWMNTLFTIGYGNDKPDDFLKRLKDSGIQGIFDVRRKGSRSWCQLYNPGEDILEWLYFGQGCSISYVLCTPLGNYDKDLEEYSRWLLSPEIQPFLSNTAKVIIQEQERPSAILCAEREAYKNGKANCHRVYVADALVRKLGDDWEVKHI